MDELKGLLPVAIGLFVVFLILFIFGSALSWLFSNPLALVLVLAAAGGLIYLGVKRHRTRTMV